MDTYSASGPALGRYPTKTSGRWLVKRSTGKLQRFDRLRDVRAALAAGAASGAATRKRGIYWASKVIHAPRWQALRDSGVDTISSWIDEAGEGQTADYVELSERCLREIRQAELLVLYCQPGEILKGALVEAGAALMNGTPVYLVGECESLSRVFRKHPLWREFQTIDAAIYTIRKGQ